MANRIYVNAMKMHYFGNFLPKFSAEGTAPPEILPHTRPHVEKETRPPHTPTSSCPLATRPHGLRPLTAVSRQCISEPWQLYTACDILATIYIIMHCMLFVTLFFTSMFKFSKSVYVYM